ncbi:MAG TPA: hypothetical protein VEI02_05695 [Planctomycetota bacterium]|nr:hypothetical protein [Planctomycetota bacterium]
MSDDARSVATPDGALADLEAGAPFHRREWRVQRVSWAIGCAVILAALAGAFGGGPLAHASATAQGGARLEYERLVRAHAPTDLSVTFRPPAGGVVAVWIDREYLAGVDQMETFPPPDRTRLLDDRCVYEFVSGGGDAARTLRIRIAHDRAGRRQGRLGIEGGDAFAFGQFVFP